MSGQCIVLRKKVLWPTASAAGTGTVFPLDYVYAPTQVRTLVTINAGTDTVTIQGTVDGGVNWVPIATHNTAATFIDTITGPWESLRVVKTGSVSNAYVAGII